MHLNGYPYQIAVPIAVAIMMVVSAACSGPDEPVHFDAGQIPYPLLGDYHFFRGNPAELNPNRRVHPYTLNSPLFSDYAGKARFIWMPEGESGIYNDSSFFRLPVGTVLIKNFYFPEDFRREEGKRRIIETRLLIHTDDGWKGFPYIWNERQTDARLQPAGGETTVQYINRLGQPVETGYIVPNMNQCLSCHSSNGAMVPIGISARQMNRDFHYNDGLRNQLLHLSQAGLLTGVPVAGNGPLPKMADFRNPASGTLEQHARAYLDANCGFCHNPAGAGNTSGLFLNHDETNPAALGFFKSPVAAGKGSGGKSYSIVPGKPDESILVYRMESTEPGIMMPELGRTMVDEEGLELIREWISSATFP
jgi:uncharacterized repeat protein (TIGR03806 family)